MPAAVLLPAVVPVLAVQIGAFELNHFGRGFGLIILVLLMISWWGPGFSELDAGVGGVREQDQFRLISQRTMGLEDRYSPRPRLFNLSDRMEAAMGRIPLPSSPCLLAPCMATALTRCLAPTSVVDAALLAAGAAPVRLFARHRRRFDLPFL